MTRTLPGFLSEMPLPPDYNPVAKAIGKAGDPEIAAALRLFASMPPSTGVFANPVRHVQPVACDGASIELKIRSFAMRGCLFEDDIVTGSADSVRVIFVGLFGRFPRSDEHKAFSLLLSKEFNLATIRVLPELAGFVKRFPDADGETAMQYMSAIRKAVKGNIPVNASRSRVDLLRDLIRVHLENAAVAACTSYMRFLLSHRPKADAAALMRATKAFLKSGPKTDAFASFFSLLLRRKVNATEKRILQNLGSIQIHHGSAGSNMVARYLASLHTRSASDLFTAAQMTLDCARHFGAITDMTDFVFLLERAPAARRDELIRRRAIAGSLPTFGHPEISAAGREAQIECDPRPALYLAPLFEAIDAGKVAVSDERMKRIVLVQRMYQLAFVEGIEKPGRRGRLRVTPNTDFGAWIVQEALGVDEIDRTLLSYCFRGFGWMMDVREQLLQPIIRPVVPPDPSIVPQPAVGGVIPDTVATVHNRLCQRNAFTPNRPGSEVAKTKSA